MQFLYDADAGRHELTISGENHKYLFKVRRYKEGDLLELRNLKDAFLYRYKIKTIHKKEAVLVLLESFESKNINFSFHLIWCIIDIKIIEKTLPMLNQLGVSKITFVYCERSQKNFRLDLMRLEKILINSSQQCGRINMMEIEIMDYLESALSEYNDIAVLDFGGEEEWENVERVLLGCEGGFSSEERKKLQNNYKIGLKTDLILKSETAAVAIASKLLI